MKAKVDKRLSGKDGNERIVSLINFIITIVIIFVESQQQVSSSGSCSGQHPGLGLPPHSCLMVLPTNNRALQSSPVYIYLHCNRFNAIIVILYAAVANINAVSVGLSVGTVHCSARHICEHLSSALSVAPDVICLL